jgi:hypothetical protein
MAVLGKTVVTVLAELRGGWAKAPQVVPAARGELADSQAAAVAMVDSIASRQAKTAAPAQDHQAVEVGVEVRRLCALTERMGVMAGTAPMA